MSWAWMCMGIGVPMCVYVYTSVSVCWCLCVHAFLCYNDSNHRPVASERAWPWQQGEDFPRLDGPLSLFEWNPQTVRLAPDCFMNDGLHLTMEAPWGAAGARSWGMYTEEEAKPYTLINPLFTFTPWLCHLLTLSLHFCRTRDSMCWILLAHVPTHQECLVPSKCAS